VKRFAELTEQEILALAISNEEEDSRIYRGFAEGLRALMRQDPDIIMVGEIRDLATAEMATQKGGSAGLRELDLTTAPLLPACPR